MKMNELSGQRINNADASYGRQHTDFAIGGVPPVGHLENITTFFDRDFLEFDEIWAAAGTPKSVFMLTFEDRIRANEGRVISVQ
jgi:prolyl-tRNA editing enzyme YbaK/EbsC (Cys-tRNA(Pro) deacylase)